MTYTIEPIDKTTVINLRGWRIVRSDGESIQPFTTRRQAEQLVEFFTEREDL